MMVVSRLFSWGCISDFFRLVGRCGSFICWLLFVLCLLVSAVVCRVVFPIWVQELLRLCVFPLIQFGFQEVNVGIHFCNDAIMFLTDSLGCLVVDGLHLHILCVDFLGELVL